MIKHFTLSTLIFAFALCTKQSSAQNTYEIKNLSDAVNSAYAELNPVISADGKNLYFVRSSHPQNQNPTEGQDIWMSEKDENGSWKPAVNLGKTFNKQQNIAPSK